MPEAKSHSGHTCLAARRRPRKRRRVTNQGPNSPSCSLPLLSKGVDMPATGPQTFTTGNGDQRRTLVVIFLRGGADGLNMVAPLQDDGYFKARPRIAIGKSKAVPLDGFYGLNPLLKDLAPAFQDGALA